MSFAGRLFSFAIAASLSGLSTGAYALNIDTSVRIEDTEEVAAAADAISNYTPLLMPSDALAHGIKLSADTKISRVENGHFKMPHGCVLIHTEEPVSIETKRASVSAKSGASIVVSAQADVTRVMNLSDRKHDSVRVVFGDYHVSLNPGEELAVVCANAPDMDKAANEFVIRYRNAQKMAVSAEYNAVLFEFSLADAMRHCLIFKQLKESPLEKDHQLLKEIIKTAAAVNTMFEKSRDQYSHGEPVLAQRRHGSRVANKNNKKKQLAFNTSDLRNE